jgi:hypothetical protein
MDEEFSSEDRVKIEIERLRRTVGHAVDLDQSSDEEAVRVDSDDSDEDGDRDQTTSSKLDVLSILILFVYGWFYGLYNSGYPIFYYPT